MVYNLIVTLLILEGNQKLCWSKMVLIVLIRLIIQQKKKTSIKENISDKANILLNISFGIVSGFISKSC